VVLAVAEADWGPRDLVQRRSHTGEGWERVIPREEREEKEGRSKTTYGLVVDLRRNVVTRGRDSREGPTKGGKRAFH